MHQATSAKVTERNVALERENKILREELTILKQGLFGRRTERIDPGQLDLYRQGFPLELSLPESPAPTNRTAKPTAKRGHGRTQFPEDLPRETVELDVPEEERACPDCGKAMRAIGEDVTERGHLMPARIVLRRYVRKKYACPDGHAVKTEAAPGAAHARTQRARRAHDRQPETREWLTRASEEGC